MVWVSFQCLNTKLKLQNTARMALFSESVWKLSRRHASKVNSMNSNRGISFEPRQRETRVWISYHLTAEAESVRSFGKNSWRPLSRDVVDDLLAKDTLSARRKEHRRVYSPSFSEWGEIFINSHFKNKCLHKAHRCTAFICVRVW